MSMATHRKPPMAVATSPLFVAFLLLGLHSTEAQIGVCYGRLGDNLPCAEDVVNLYKYYNIGAMRLYEPDLPTLEALQGTNIQLMLGVRNQDIQCIGSDQSNADDWVGTNVLPYATTIKYIAVGNEIKPNDKEASWVEPAMQNILCALNANELGTQIKVSTAIDTGLIQKSYPPSLAEFSNLTYITPIIEFLTTNDSPLLVNIEPYIAYVSDRRYIKLDYALFKNHSITFNDTYNGVNRGYKNLFDATYDAVYIALQKVVTPRNEKDTDSLLYDVKQKKNNIKPPRPPVNSESGWPSKGGLHHPTMMKNNGGRIMSGGGQQLRYQTAAAAPQSEEKHDDVATVENAKAYYTNLIKHVKEGTPLTKGQEIESYLFAMFDEDKKAGDDDSERFYGLFMPDQQPKYGHLAF
ncbi:hypothetical protein SOVF_031130 [Spinacia oleracea]|uniref:Glucan endo-1,3-beta-glucosidase n=1 Tax=Spinacia oleracea TaxID=3562 RepID=A0A9R0JQE2_SPIOL|nr:glucan endo-1,3-beta-glucosidase-like [Spinacia oleracea]KNA22623.1 hypothetical protein SOVF_031130 [Spinacia oleracea]